LPTAASIVLALAGTALALATIGSAVRATILPRGVPVRVARVINSAVRLALRVRTGGSASFERRDAIMASFGPIALLALLVAWLMMIFVAFVLLFLGTATSSVTKAVELSGSSMFTLGTTAGHSVGADLLSYSEAGMGLLMVTLLITYLPSIYAAFSRRERGVTLLRVRAGTPPKASSMLIRYHRIEGGQYRLSDLWKTWETWFADVEESHTSFSILNFFRSPQPDNSWIVAAGVVLDAASMWVAAIQHPIDPDAQLCIRSGYLALQRIAAFFKIPFDPDPAADDPITISRSEWDEEWALMERAGVKLNPDKDEAWRAYHGWRVNYDSVLLNLARLVEAPPTPWVSDRSPLRERERWWVTSAAIADRVRSRREVLRPPFRRR
jgi:hypothetical protein